MALPASDLELANLALSNLEHTIEIVSLTTDTTVEAKAARRFLDLDRDRALAAYPWRWAEKRAILVELAGQTHERWTYFYTPPTGMVPGTGRFWSGDVNPSPADLVPFEELLNAAGTGIMIACDEEAVSGSEPVFFFTSRVTTYSIYPAPWVYFFAWVLAADMAIPVKKDPTGRARLNALREAQLAFNQALAADLRGRQARPAPPTPSLAARGNVLRRG